MFSYVLCVSGLSLGSVTDKENQSKKFEGVQRDHMEVKESFLALLSDDDEDATDLDQITYIHALDTKQKGKPAAIIKNLFFL